MILTWQVHQIPFNCQKHAFSTPFQLWTASLRFSFPPFYTLHGGARLQAGIWWKKGSFLPFWISYFCRLLREGVGWPQRPPLSRTGLTTLIWPCSALLLRSTAPLCSALLWDSFYPTWYDIWCPRPLDIHSVYTYSNSFSWHWTSTVIELVQFHSLNMQACHT